MRNKIMYKFEKLKNIDLFRKLIIILGLFLFNFVLSIINKNFEIFKSAIIFLFILFLIECIGSIFFYIKHKIIKYKKSSFLKEFFLLFILYEIMFLIPFSYTFYEDIDKSLNLLVFLFSIIFFNYLLLKYCNFNNYRVYTSINRLDDTKKELINNYFFNLNYIIFIDLNIYNDNFFIKFKDFNLEIEDEEIYFKCNNKKCKLNSLLDYLKINDKKLEDLKNDDLDIISVFDY